MAFKALAIDLDGTLLVGEDLSDANRKAVRRAFDAGFAVIIATARWRQMAQRIAERIGISGPVIACSGAEVHVPAEGLDIFDERLPEDFVAALYEVCDAVRCIATITAEERVLIKLDGEPDLARLGPEMLWVPKLAGTDYGTPRVGVIQGSAAIRTIREELQPRFSERVNFYGSVGPTGRPNLTVTSARADKGAALASACAYLGVSPDTVLAFGDAENDLSMFRVAGASVAMGQADARVKQAATAITLPHDEDGVAHVIEHLLERGSLP